MKNIFSSFLLLFFTWQLSAQSFSNDPETFRQQVLQFLKTTNTQKSLNIGAPFDKSWNEQLNQGAKRKTHRDHTRDGRKTLWKGQLYLVI